LLLPLKPTSTRLAKRLPFLKPVVGFKIGKWASKDGGTHTGSLHDVAPDAGLVVEAVAGWLNAMGTAVAAVVFDHAATATAARALGRILDMAAS
jgi:hypothetical protein